MAHPSARIGYCTNVHAGTDLATIRETLQRYAVPIADFRLRRKPDAGPLPVGLWIPASAASELSGAERAADFAGWLSSHHLSPLTINGFPYDNFHLPVVKHRVYRPAWWESSRLEYTVQLAHLLDKMLPENAVGSISTLPLGWPGRLGRINVADSAAADGPLQTNDRDDDAGIDQANVSLAGQNLRVLAEQLQRIEQASGRRIVVAIEPEPGCLLDRCGDVVRFFEKELPEANQRRYLTVCHDVCHSAVMFESQSEALRTYARAGIAVGKVQISSAIDVPLAEYSAEDRRAAVDELREFAEDRYLHQTGILDSAGRFRLIEDLPQWLDTVSGELNQNAAMGEPVNDRHLRIHFHVPIFRQSLGRLRSTQQAISECVAALQEPAAPDFTGHYEVETYAWTVLPESMIDDAPTAIGGELSGLAAGIARELDWFEAMIDPYLPNRETAKS
jgi:hypothetical protein